MAHDVVSGGLFVTCSDLNNLRILLHVHVCGITCQQSGSGAS